MAKSNKTGDRRKARIRRAIVARSYGRPRLSVFRSSKQIYAQVIDDEKGVTIVAASSLEKTLRETLKTGANGTDITVSYAVGGYAKDGFDAVSKGVDHVLGEQIERLRKFIET